MDERGGGVQGPAGAAEIRAQGAEREEGRTHGLLVERSGQQVGRKRRAGKNGRRKRESFTFHPVRGAKGKTRGQDSGWGEGGGGAATPEKFTVSTVIPRLELKDV